MGKYKRTLITFAIFAVIGLLIAFAWPIIVGLFAIIGLIAISNIIYVEWHRCHRN